MDYYDFELEVLQNLHNRLQVDTVSVSRESEEAIQKRKDKNGKLYDFVLYKYHGAKSIILNFKYGFHYTISEAWLQTAFEGGVDTEYVSNVLIDDICEDFINKVIKK